MTTPKKKDLPTEHELAQASEGISLEDYRRQQQRDPLTAKERRVVLDGIELVMQGIYTHLPLKQARYGFDPLQRLRIVRTQVDDMSAETFNAELGDIFARLRDWHTGYWRPGAGANVAVLPFIIEMCGSVEAPRYLISKVGKWARQDGFVPGVAIDTWNSVPIDRMVLRHADEESGGRPDSARAMALTTLTQRPLFACEPPDEEEVRIGYRVLDDLDRPNGERKYAAFKWRVVDTSVVDRFRGDSAFQRHRPSVRVMAINPVAAAVKKATLMLYASTALRGQDKLPEEVRAAAPAKGIQTEAVKVELANGNGIVRAAKVHGGRVGEEYGYLRIFTFDVPRTKGFLLELARLLALLPQRGLMVDVRANPGGTVVAAEMALQFFTPRRIEPVRFSWRATDFTRQYSRLDANFDAEAPWRPSLEAAIRNGEAYSAAIPVTDPDRCPIVGQVYGGPVVLVADSTTYSSGDLFTAGFVDNKIGTYLCVGHSTGAGGACVVDYDVLQQELIGTQLALPAMPNEAGMGISLMRATRAGDALGTPIEDVGVPAQPEHRYSMTRADVMEGNRNLLAKCVDILRKQPCTGLNFDLSEDRRQLRLNTEGLDQVDVRIDRRALASLDANDETALKIEVPQGTRHVEVSGYKKGDLRQRRVIPVQ